MRINENRIKISHKLLLTDTYLASLAFAKKTRKILNSASAKGASSKKGGAIAPLYLPIIII